MSQALIDDAIWARLEPLIPKRRVRRGHRHGGTPIPDRAMLTGILFVLRSGIPWQMLPRQMGCGSGSTCWRRLIRWQRAGVWQRLHEKLLAQLRVAGASISARRSSTAGPSAPCAGEQTGPNPTDRRKKGSTHHLITDARGIPLVAQLTAANVNDITHLDPMLDALPAVRGRRGRPRQKPGALQGDRAYDSPPHRERLWARGERTIAWLRRFRRLTVRYERRADVHQAFLTLGCVLICWNYLKAPRRVF